jgi:hypothetical protein
MGISQNHQLSLTSATGLSVLNGNEGGLASLFQGVTQSELQGLELLFEHYELEKAGALSVIDGLKEFDSSSIDAVIQANVSQSIAAGAYSIFNGVYSKEKTVKYLDAKYWNKAINLTDVLKTMPTDRKLEWQNNIKELNTPAFERDSVIPTLIDLLNARLKFFAERAAGVFNNLSKEHVTNCSFGFSKRLIIAGVSKMISGSGYSYIDINSTVAGYISDLRILVGQISGRANLDSQHGKAYEMLQYIGDNKLFGEWMTIDAGQLRIKLFKKGTVHIEVQPETAAILNNCLAAIYPTAIPAERRKQPSKPSKVWDKRYSVSLSIETANLISGIKRYQFNRNEAPFYTFNGKDYKDFNKAVKSELNDVFDCLGLKLNSVGHFTCDYDPTAVLAHIAFVGCYPEKVSHQAFFTPETLAERAASQLDIKEGGLYLEPSAGAGALAKYLPKDSTLVEVSSLRTMALKSQGFENIIEMDFLEFAKTTHQRFDGVLMNPPFTDGQAKAHVEAASELLCSGGQLVAIVPSNLSTLEIDGFYVESSESISNAFDDAGVSVVILEITRH